MIISEYKAKVKFSLGAGDSVKPRYRRCARNRHLGAGWGATDFVVVQTDAVMLAVDATVASP